MEFNAGTITMVLIILGYVVFMIKLVAPHTSTKADDKAAAAIDKAIGWAERYAPLVWEVIEVAANQGKIPAAQKLLEFRKHLEEAYQNIHGQAMPAEAKAAAEALASGLSAAHKRGKLEGPAIPFSSQPEGPAGK